MWLMFWAIRSMVDWLGDSLPTRDNQKQRVEIQEGDLPSKGLPQGHTSPSKGFLPASTFSYDQSTDEYSAPSDPVTFQKPSL